MSLLGIGARLQDGRIQGPLSRRPEHLIGYGFIGPEGNRSGNWQMSPQQPFAAMKVYAWMWAGQSATIDSLSFHDCEQLMDSLPAELFTTWTSPRQFLSLYAGIEDARDGNHRVELSTLPGQTYLTLSLGLPTLSIGQRFEVRWTGPLAGFFICGRELQESALDIGSIAPGSGSERASSLEALSLEALSLEACPLSSLLEWV